MRRLDIVKDDKYFNPFDILRGPLTQQINHCVVAIILHSRRLHRRLCRFKPFRLLRLLHLPNTRAYLRS